LKAIEIVQAQKICEHADFDNSKI